MIDCHRFYRLTVGNLVRIGNLSHKIGQGKVRGGLDERGKLKGIEHSIFPAFFFSSRGTNLSKVKITVQPPLHPPYIDRLGGVSDPP